MFKAQMAGFRRDKVANVFSHPKISCFVSLIHTQRTRGLFLHLFVDPNPLLAAAQLFFTERQETYFFLFFLHLQCTHITQCAISEIHVHCFSSNKWIFENKHNTLICDNKIERKHLVSSTFCLQGERSHVSGMTPPAL